MPVLGSGGHMTTGNVFFVQNTNGSDGNDGLGPATPLKTLDYAIGKCTASQGDTIFLMEGHAETVTTKIALDVAGINIIGLGAGDVRPTITVNAAIWGLTVSASDLVIANVRFVAGSSVTTATKLAKVRNVSDVSFVDCAFEIAYDMYQAVVVHNSSANDNIVFANCVFENSVTTSASAHPQTALLISGGNGIATGVTVKGCRFVDFRAKKAERWRNCIVIGGVGDVLIKDTVLTCRGAAIAARSAGVSANISIVRSQGISTSSNTATGNIMPATYANIVDSYVLGAVNKRARMNPAATD
jgi:hypothetical protein